MPPFRSLFILQNVAAQRPHTATKYSQLPSGASAILQTAACGSASSATRLLSCACRHGGKKIARRGRLFIGREENDVALPYTHQQSKKNKERREREEREEIRRQEGKRKLLPGHTHAVQRGEKKMSESALPTFS